MSEITLEDNDFLYHVTTYARLANIAQEGLQPGRARSIGASALDAHARRGIFFTEPKGVIFWFGRAEIWADDGSDDPFEDLLVPVVLRIFDDEDILGELDSDDIGTRDAGGEPAWIGTQPIAPEDIEIWDGSEWIPIADWENVDPEQSFDTDSDEDDEGGPIEFHVFKSDNPLLPYLGW